MPAPSTYPLTRNRSSAGGPALWGTCLGFQTISDVAGGGEDLLTEFQGVEKVALPVTLQEGWNGSRLGRAAPAWVRDALISRNSTPNFHLYGVNVSTFETLPGLRLLATSEDSRGQTFASILEHVSARVFAVQWHPEAYLTIGNDANAANAIDFTDEGVSLMQWFGRFFVGQSRKTGNRWARASSPPLVDYLPSSKDGKDFLLLDDTGEGVEGVELVGRESPVSVALARV